MLLVEESLEFRAIKSICDSPRKISNLLLSAVDASYFNSAGAGEAYQRVMVKVRTKGKAPSYMELCADAALSDDTKEELRSYKKKAIDDKEDMKTLVEQLSTYRKARILFNLSDFNIKALSQDKVDIPALIEKAAEAVGQARSTQNLERRILNIGKGGNAKSVVKDLLSNTKADVVPTGFNTFDSRNGGFYLGSLVLIAATTGGGKSTMMNQLLMNMATVGYSSCLVPLEMTEKESMARVLANLAGVDVRKFMMGNLTKNEIKKVDKAYQRWQSGLKKLDSKFSVFEPEEDMSAEEIAMMLDPYGYTVKGIDYMGLLKGVDGDDSWQQLGKAARFLKIHTKINHKLTMIAAQLSDDGALRYSRAMAEHANNAWYWTWSDENAETGLIEIRQAKARNQQPFTFQLACDFTCMQIRDVHDGEAEQMMSSDGDKKRKKFNQKMDDLEKYLEDASDDD